MKRHVLFVLLALVVAMPASAQLTNYSQDFEGLLETGSDQPDQLALQSDGWLAYVNVFNSGGGFLYPYGPFGAPNGGFGGPAFSAVVLGESGVDQGAQVVSIYSDYNNVDHGVGNLIEASVFQEQNIAAEDVGKTCTFAWDHKRGGIDGATTAAAFIKVLDPNSGYGLSGGGTVDTTFLTPDWDGDSLQVVITPAMIPGGTGALGHILQFGFTNTASNYEGSSNFYDNVTFSCDGDPQGVPTMSNVALIVMLGLLATAILFVVARTTMRRVND